MDDEQFWEKGLPLSSDIYEEAYQQEDKRKDPSKRFENGTVSRSGTRDQCPKTPQRKKLAPKSSPEVTLEENKNETGKAATMVDSNSNAQAPAPKRITRRKVTRSRTNDSLGRVTLPGRSLRTPIRRTKSFDKYGEPDFKWQNYRAQPANNANASEDKSRSSETKDTSSMGSETDSENTVVERINRDNSFGEPAMRWEHFQTGNSKRASMHSYIS